MNFETPFQLVIATILSAQCTDERVNKVTEVLFEKYPDAVSLAQADLRKIENIVHSTGFYKAKAKNIIECSKKIVYEHNNQVPQTVEQLIKLDGVGRKTANVVLGNAFNIVSGIVVDTHVTRLSNRLKFTSHENVLKIELDLQKIVPKKDWIQFSHWMISHGRSVCKARSPDCENCFLNKLCPSKEI